MASTQGKSNPLFYLLLGLAMDSISEQTSQCGGWSREGILQVLQSLGISKITTRMESLKNKSTDFPWSECALEYKHWKEWYQKAVWIVRKRIVEGLAKSSGDDSSDEEPEGGPAAAVEGHSREPTTPSQPSSHSSNNKTLHKLLNQQSNEMEELRQALEEAQARIVVQESQLETWKRRMESTPTELDNMLNEFTAKTADLEESIQKMQTEAKQTQAQHEAELDKRDEALEEQRQEAERLRTEEQGAREERDRMEQELQGLSQAYASLEEEFRQHTASSTGAPTGETGDHPPQQSQGEDSQQNATTTGSTEVATLREEINRLRSENGRLRDSAMEADNWMSMAVQRMNDMGAENANLQQQMAAVHVELQQLHGANEEKAEQLTQERIAAAEYQLQEEMSLRQGAETQLSASTAEVQEQKKHVLHLQEQVSSAQEELRSLSEKARTDVIDLQRQLEEANFKRSGESEAEGRRILELQKQLSILQEESRKTVVEMEAQILHLQRQVEAGQQQPAADVSGDNVQETTLQELRTELQETVASKDAEIKALQASLEQAQQASPTAESGSHDSSLTRVINSEHVQQELDAVRHEAEQINLRSQEEIYKKESRIRELEDRLNSGLGEYTMEDIRIRDEEIEELRSANEAAQEWMAKAVEHHQVLTNQVRTLTEEKSTLSSHLNDLQGQPNSNTSEASLKLYESQLEQTTSELQDLRSQLASQEQELSSLKTTRSGLEQDLEIARDDLGNLKRQYEQSAETVAELEARLAENALSTENESLRASNEDLNSRLGEFQAWADVVQTKIAEILAAKENAEELLAKASEQLKTKDKALKTLEDKLESFQSDSETEPVAHKDSARLAALESANKTLSIELTEVRDHNSSLQAWAETARNKIDELSQEKPNTIMQTDTELRDRLGEEMVAGEKLCEECEILKKKYIELETFNRDLQTRTESAQKQIFELRETQRELEGSLSSAEQEVSKSRDEIDRIRQLLRSETGNTAGVLTEQPGADVIQTSTASEFFGSGATSTESAEKAFDTNPAEQFFVAAPSSSEGGSIVDFLRQQLRQKEEDIKSLQQGLSDDDGIVRKWEDRVAELEQEVKSLHTQIEEREEEADAAIAQWQESLAGSEKKCSDLEAGLEAAQKQIEFLRSSKETVENNEEGFQSSKEELDEKIASLEHAIDEEMDELHIAAMTPTDVDGAGVAVLTRELKEAQEALNRDEDLVAEWEDRVAELEATVTSLQQQLQEQEDEANGVISQWQESYNEAGKRCEEIEKELEELRKTKESPVPDARENIDRESRLSREQEEEFIAKIESLEMELSEAQKALASDEDVVNQWEERVMELETLVKTLQSQLEEQEQDASEAIALWQNNATEADEKAREVDEKLSKEVSSLQSTIMQIDKDRSTLKDKIAELHNSLASMQSTEVLSARDVDLAKELEKTEKELDEAKETLARDEDVVKQWEERSASLEAQIQLLERQLVDQEEEARNVLQQWQDSYSELEEKLAMHEEPGIATDESLLAQGELKSQLKEKDDELKIALETIQRDESIVEQWEERVAVLESSVQTLREQLTEQEKEAELAIASWQGKHSELEQQCSGLELQLSTSEAELVRANSGLRYLEAQLNDRAMRPAGMQAIAEARDEFESKLDEYKMENAGLREEIASERESRRVEREQLRAELADERGRHAEARDEIEELTRSIEVMRSDSEEVENQWTERVDELTCTVQDLEVQLQEQEADANEAISIWEKKAEELETEIEVFSNLVAELKVRLDVEEDSMILLAFEDIIKARDSTILLLQTSSEKTESLEGKIFQLEASLDTQKSIVAEIEQERTQHRQHVEALSKQLAEARNSCEELASANEGLLHSKEAAKSSLHEYERSEELLKKQVSGLENELGRVQEDRKRLKEMLASHSREKLQEERDRLTVVIAQLEEELREANDMVQAYVTDASSRKATEIAGEALRDEIEHLRFQTDEYRVAAENEKAAREASDLEIERLRDDITALIALGDQAIGSEDIQLFTAKASEKLKSKERQEIEQIRKSLYRAIDELEVARAAEKEANEKLSKARLQNSVCEQEIVAAKSEIIFLTQTLEDMRLAEEGKRASLEYHIKSLEDESDVLRKYSTDELQTVRNELAQISMEKDRILSQLKESEKTNKALVVSASKGDFGNSDARHEAEDLEAEVAKLKVENAYLLTISANDKSRAERRLREMLRAQAAATETDTILEHELRIAAEATIQTLKIEIEQLIAERKDEGEENIGSSRKKNPGSTDGLADEIDSLRKEIQKLKNENSALKSKLEQEASKAREKVELLTEECRRAQSKSHKAERQGRFDAAVKSEIARSRMSPGIATPERKPASQEDWMLVSNDPAMDRSDGIMTSSEAYDLINKQKDEIQEERQMYLEFLSEHEDLLALLAQHDIERAFLKSFMAERLGEDVVDQAIQEAEKTSRSKFGQTIRASY